MAQAPTLESLGEDLLRFLKLVVHRVQVAKCAVLARLVKLEIQHATHPKSSLGTLILEVQRTTCLIR